MRVRMRLGAERGSGPPQSSGPKVLFPPSLPELEEGTGSQTVRSPSVSQARHREARGLGASDVPFPPQQAPPGLSLVPSRGCQEQSRE